MRGASRGSRQVPGRVQLFQRAICTSPGCSRCFPGRRARRRSGDPDRPPLHFLHRLAPDGRARAGKARVGPRESADTELPLTAFRSVRRPWPVVVKGGSHSAQDGVWIGFGGSSSRARRASLRMRSAPLSGRAAASVDRRESPPAPSSAWRCRELRIERDGLSKHSCARTSPLASSSCRWCGPRAAPRRPRDLVCARRAPCPRSLT